MWHHCFSQSARFQVVLKLQKKILEKSQNLLVQVVSLPNLCRPTRLNSFIKTNFLTGPS